MRKTNIFKKIIMVSIVSVLILQQVPLVIKTETISSEIEQDDHSELSNEEFIRILYNENELIELYASPDSDEEIVTQVESNTEALLMIDENTEGLSDDEINIDEHFSKITLQLEPNELGDVGETIIAYVLTEFLYTVEEYQELVNNTQDSSDSDTTDSENDINGQTESSNGLKQETELESTSSSETVESKPVEQIASPQRSSNRVILNGIALKDQTRVYSERSRNSTTLRSYAQGTALMYWEFNSSWYEALVILDGVRQTGYIHKDDVETLDLSNQTLLKGISLGKTNVYTRPSKKAGTHRSYQEGHILMYKTFSQDWYEALVFINGVGKTGYIHKQDVESLDLSNQTLVNGLALRHTNVYTRPSKNAGTHRSYQEGHILMYKTFSQDWYEALVFINGVGKTGYIHKQDVETLDLSNQTLLDGIALRRTNVYTRPSKNASTHRSYPVGQILMYKTFSTEWYEAIVFINGVRKTGYIHAEDVETVTGEQISLEGYASAATTRVYSRASRNSSVLRAYPRGRLLYFKTFSRNWYEAIVILNGVRHTGYIHHDDVSFDPLYAVNYTNYNYSFSRMVDIQLTRTPKADGAGNIAAGRNLIEYYANPSNFREGEDGFYQFLVLTSPVGLDVNEVNRVILDRSKGTLAGTAAAFVEAGQRYGVNEAYLIAHALHETGNGTSQLAQGVTINGKKVYNMFGTAAYDGTAVSSGAQYAYDKGWFTPEAAIIGGAQFVAKNYIHAGQDTLYKIRWNPDNPGEHQYATHVAWAQIQTNRIATIYNQLENHVKIFDVPRFQNQPSYSGPNPPPNDIGFTDFASGALGETTGTNVRFRTHPSTGSNSTIISTIANRGTQLELLGTNNQGWYKAKYNGREGWISADYVNAINVLQVSASALKVRPNANTNNSPIGSLPNGTIVTGVLDSNNKLVTSREWYKIYYNNTEAWISSGSNHQYIQVR